jgi:hypothetical protein
MLEIPILMDTQNNHLKSPPTQGIFIPILAEYCRGRKLVEIYGIKIKNSKKITGE